MMAYAVVKDAGMVDADTAASADTAEWQARAKNLLKGELKRRGVTYAQLAEKLAAVGVRDSEPNIRNKIARGGFTVVFLLQVMAAIGAREIRLD